MLGLKSLLVSWVYSSTYEVMQFLQKAPMVEEICLMDVGEAVLEAIAEAHCSRGPSRASTSGGGGRMGVL